MSSTVWPARLVGDRVLCGRRQVNGQYLCTGEIAYYLHGTLTIPPGLVEDAADPGMYRWSNRAQERLNRGDRPQFKQGWQRNITGHLVQGWKWVEPPLRRACPHCNCIALVDSGVLG